MYEKICIKKGGVGGGAENDKVHVWFSHSQPHHCLSSGMPLVQVPYTYLARPVVRLADGAYLMTQGPATPEHDRDGDLHCMEDMLDSWYLWPCESRGGGQETAVPLCSAATCTA